MKLYLVYRNGNVDLDEYESAIVIADSREAVIELLKANLEKRHGAGNEEMWGNFDVTITEILLDEPKIILQMLCGG